MKITLKNIERSKVVFMDSTFFEVPSSKVEYINFKPSQYNPKGTGKVIKFLSEEIEYGFMLNDESVHFGTDTAAIRIQQLKQDGSLVNYKLSYFDEETSEWVKGDLTSSDLLIILIDANIKEISHDDWKSYNTDFGIKSNNIHESNKKGLDLESLNLDIIK